MAGRVGYIGQDSHSPSRLNLVRRRKEKGCKKLYRALRKYPLSVWHIEILAKGFKSAQALDKAEIAYIKKFDSRRKGYNCTDGGGGNLGVSPSAQTRAKLSAAHKGKIFSLEHRANLSKAAKRYPRYSAEGRAKLSAAHIGKVMSPQHRASLARAGRGRKFSKATKMKISNALRGNKNGLGHTPSIAARRKMSLAAIEREKQKRLKSLQTIAAAA